MCPNSTAAPVPMSTTKDIKMPCSVSVNGITVTLGRQQTQADQEYDFNIISAPLPDCLGAKKQSLTFIGFAGMCMNIANH